MWFHCRQAANTAASHCGKGMVFAVNPGTDDSNDSFGAFKTKALDKGKQLAASNGTTTNSTAPNGILQPISDANNTALNGTGNGTTTSFSGTAVFNNPIDEKTTVNGTFADGTMFNITQTNNGTNIVGTETLRGPNINGTVTETFTGTQTFNGSTFNVTETLSGPIFNGTTVSNGTLGMNGSATFEGIATADTATSDKLFNSTATNGTTN